MRRLYWVNGQLMDGELGWIRCRRRMLARLRFGAFLAGCAAAAWILTRWIS